MDRYERDRLQGGIVFFIHVGGISARDFRKMTVWVAMKTYTAIDTLRAMPIKDLEEIMEDVMEAQDGEQ